MSNISSPRSMKAVCSAIGAALALACSHAGAFSEVVVFGDSLSDNGNVFALTQNFPGNPLLPFPGPPYVGGRQSNGPVAVEYLAQHLGATLRDFAQVGATTGTANIWDDGSLGAPAGSLHLSGMQTQVQTYVAQPGPASGSALYVFWGGPNDFVSGLNNPATFDAQATIAAAVGNLAGELGALYAEGARHFLVPGMADLGLSPRLSSMGFGQLATDLTLAFNDALGDALDLLGANLAGANIHRFDSFGLSHLLQAQFAGGDPNAPEATMACLAVPACASDPAVWDSFLFWDELHPTTKAHSLVGAAMAAAVPEPGSWALMLSGLALAGWRLRQRHRFA